MLTLTSSQPPKADLSLLPPATRAVLTSLISFNRCSLLLTRTLSSKNAASSS